MTIRMRILIFFILYFSVLRFGFGQDNYILLADPTGIDRQSYDENLELEVTEILDYFTEVNNALGATLPADFKVYDFGAYLHNASEMTESEILEFSRSLTESDNRIIFNKISDKDGVWSNVIIDVNLNLDLLDCYDNDFIQSEVQTEFEAYYDDFPKDYEFACSKALNRFQRLISKAVCCYLNIEPSGLNRNDRNSSIIKLRENLACDDEELEDEKEKGILQTNFFSNNFVSNTGTILTFQKNPEKIWFKPNGSVKQFKIDDIIYRSCIYISDPTIFAGYRKECSFPSIPPHKFAKKWNENDEASVNVGISKEKCITHIYNFDYKAKHNDLVPNGGIDHPIIDDLGLNFEVTYERLKWQQGMDNYTVKQEFIPKYGEQNFYFVIDYTENGYYPCPDKTIPYELLGPYSPENVKIIRQDNGFWQPTPFGWVYFYEDAENFNSYHFWLYNPQGDNFISFVPKGLGWQRDSEFLHLLLNDLKTIFTNVDTYIYITEGVGVVAGLAGSAPVSIGAGLAAGALYLYKGDYGNAILSTTFVVSEAIIFFENGKYFVKLDELFRLVKNADNTPKITPLLDDIPETLKDVIKNYGFEADKNAASFLNDLASNASFREFLEKAGEKGVKAWEGLINIPTLRKNIDWLTRSSKWLDEGAEFVTTNGVTKLRKGADDILEIKNEKILPNKYDYPVSTGTPIGEASNGYQVVKNGNSLSVRRVPETDGYSQAELDLLTQNPASHVLEKHGHDVTDAALIKRATGEGSPVPGKSYSPDGELGGIPSHSTKFADQQAVKDALENVKPGTLSFAARELNPATGNWIVEHPGNFGYGYAANTGVGPIPMVKVKAVYKEVTPGNFELITMFPEK